MDKKINIQVPISLKEKEILDRVIVNRLGISINSAVMMFLKKVIEEKGLPFEVELQKPNDAALELM
ncbi:MAG: type II toxin-antitoxin system RelB/DinJ family antitoxin [Clostridia bacterium]|nr:type II toxin-antitoxin system RelB/DinJ family antitoxin [Clostridia bacterium]